MRARARVRTGAAVAVLLAVAGLVLVPPGAAQADTPTVVVTPDVVAAGDTVDLATSGFPFGYSAVVLCDSAAAEPGGGFATNCGLLDVLGLPGPVPPTATVGVRAIVATFDNTRRLDCATAPDGCVIGVVTLSSPAPDDSSVLAEAYDPITLLASPADSPRHGLVDGATVTVTASGVDEPAGGWTVAPCASGYLDHPTPARAALLCGPPVLLADDPTGLPAADLVVHDPLVPVAGAPVPCGHHGCALVLSGATRPAAAFLGVAFGPTVLSVTPSHDLVPPMIVEVAVSGAPVAPDRQARFRHCLLPSGPVQDETRCSWGDVVPVDAWGTGAREIGVDDELWPSAGGGPVDCRTASCGFAMFTEAGDLVAESNPLTFAPRPVVGMAPSEGLLDGEAMTVTGTHLRPGGYLLHHCGPRGCTADQPVTVGSAGTLEVTTPASQRFTTADGAVQLCRRDACRVELVSERPGLGYFPMGYAMAAGDLAVAPDTGLQDGQEVQVTGDGLMASYDGPALLGFATGGWALTQCAAAVLDDPGLFGVLTHCSVAPPTTGVDVPGSTLATTFPVAATITRILGGTTDCTTGPGACVVGLVRFEQDASLSTHLRPVAFG
jgi:hypothetical protein